MTLQIDLPLLKKLRSRSDHIFSSIGHVTIRNLPSLQEFNFDKSSFESVYKLTTDNPLVTMVIERQSEQLYMQPPQHTWNEVNPEMTAIYLRPEQGNQIELEILDFSAYANLEQLFLFEKCFREIRHVVIENLANLKMLMVGDYCFDVKRLPENDERYTVQSDNEEDNEEDNGEEGMAQEEELPLPADNSNDDNDAVPIVTPVVEEDRSIFARFTLRHCPSLTSVRMGTNAFRRFYYFELSDCPSLTSINMKAKNFRGARDFVLEGE